jgi:hypothetical protein
MSRHQFTTASALALVLLLGSAGTTRAQDDPDAEPRRIDVGIDVSKFGAMHGGGLGARVTTGAGRDAAFEAGLAWMDLGRTEHLPDQIVWLYFARAKLRLEDADRLDTFVTVGIDGWAERNGTPNGLAITLGPPLLPETGIGAEWRVAPRLALRVDARLIWAFSSDLPLVMPVLSGGVSVPIR